ncbi:LLM class flavin-dependent oxidoreductase [Streptomyces sp. NPDC049597]|uniref:LLM class flavin-dependent oxidoreductase n=1 Tax=Streptomyces sp. NPDC049597 TaxID=3155276 RepID=UPI0034350435
MTDHSFLVPFVPTRPEQLLPFAALSQWSKAVRLWQGQGTASDTHQAFSYAAATGFRVPVGTSVSLMPFCHPYDAALRAQSLAAAMGHSVVAGYGPGAKVLQRSILGSPYRSQLGAVRDYVTILRGLLTDGKADHEGEFYSCSAVLPRLPLPPVEIGLGVLRPRMAELAGEVADVAITWLTPAAYLKDTVVPALRAGAERAGRAMPRVVAMVPVALDGPERDATKLALAGNSGHMSLPHYTDMLSRSGIDVDMRADPEASGKALVGGNAFLFGNESEVRDKLREFADAGADEIVFNVTGVALTQGGTAALRELEQLLRLVDAA